MIEFNQHVNMIHFILLTIFIWLNMITHSMGGRIFYKGGGGGGGGKSTSKLNSLSIVIFHQS